MNAAAKAEQLVTFTHIQRVQPTRDGEFYLLLINRRLLLAFLNHGNFIARAHDQHPPKRIEADQLDNARWYGPINRYVAAALLNQDEDAAEQLQLATLLRPVNLPELPESTAAQVPTTTPPNLIDLVIRMRDAQRRWFKTNKREALDQSKRLEKQLDELLQSLSQPTLF